MPFIIIFNIIVCVAFSGVLVTIMGCSIALKDCAKKSGEEAIKLQLKIEKIKMIAYTVFIAVVLLMIVVNILF